MIHACLAVLATTVTPPVVETFDESAGFAGSWPSLDFARTGRLVSVDGYVDQRRSLSIPIRRDGGPGPTEVWFALSVELDRPLESGYRNFSPINAGQHWTLGFFAGEGEGKRLVWDRHVGPDATEGVVHVLARIRFGSCHYDATAWAGHAREPDVDAEPFVEGMQRGFAAISELMFNADGSPGTGMVVHRLAFAATREEALNIDAKGASERAVEFGAWPASASALDRLGASTSPLANGDAIAFLGDSITEQGGYIEMLRQRLEAHRPGVRLINAGHSGFRVPDISPRLESEVIPNRPRVVVVFIGINDVWHWQLSGKGTTKEDFESGLRSIVERARAAGVRVVVASPSVVGERARGTNDLDADLDAYAEIGRRVAHDARTRLGHVEFVDLRATFFEFLGEHNAEGAASGITTYDGVHMLPAGDEVILEALAPAIERVLR